MGRGEGWRGATRTAARYGARRGIEGANQDGCEVWGAERDGGANQDGCKVCFPVTGISFSGFLLETLSVI